VAKLASKGNNSSAIVGNLKPILDSKCPFAKLDYLGSCLGKAGKNDTQKFYPLFDEIINYGAMGGFVVVGRSLTCFLETDFNKVMEKSREYIIAGDVWYVCDVIGERSLGQALIDQFDTSLTWLRRFLEDENKWVKRSAGVAIHFFSKRVTDKPEKTKKLLCLIEPFIEERQVEVIKGIGWGLKTIGRYHPKILVNFLTGQIKMEKKISKLMIKKAVTYLNKNERAIIEDCQGLQA
jgi:3-methyladenine DNA glycosylase AlkD